MKFVKISLLAIFALGFVVRLYKIDNPVADWHSWRQADTAAVTRNFVKDGLTLLTPRFDDFSDVSNKGLFNPSGFRMVEFPVFNLIHYLFTVSFPFETLEYWGRMTSILSSLASGGFIYLLVKKHLGYKTGVLASGIFLLLPYNIYFSRVILPDPLMVTLYLASFYFFENKSTRILAGVFACLATLVKPVSMIFLLPLIWYSRDGLKDIKYYLKILAVLAPFILWRMWVMKFPEGTPAFWWLLNGNGIRFKPSFFRWIFGERLATLILGRWGIVPFIMGIPGAVASYFGPWLVAALVYVVIFATGNVQHDYYQIPIMPILSIVVAMGVSYWSKFEKSWSYTWVKRVLLGFCMIFMFAFSWYDIRGYYQVNHWDIVHAGEAAQRIIPENAVVLAPYGGDTALLYQINRRGFPYIPLPIKDLIDRFGASYLVSVNYDDQTNAAMQKYTVVESTPGYVIIRLEEPKSPPDL